MEMPESSSFQLGRYQIIESSDGTLRWETHAGFAALKGGRCLVEGSILILGPPEFEKTGFFKTEFLEHLRKLPRWEKTVYYCQSHAVYQCKSGARISFPRGGSIAKRNPSQPANPVAAGKRGHSETKGSRPSHGNHALNGTRRKVGSMVDLLKSLKKKIRALAGGREEHKK